MFEFEIVDCIELAEAECECRAVNPPFISLKLETEDDALGGCVKTLGGSGFGSSSCPTHQSQSTQPNSVAIEPPPTTDMGEMCLSKMPTKQQTKIMTLQTC